MTGPARSRKPAARPFSPLQYAVAQLARREHSRAELRAKLRRKLRDESDPAEVASKIEEVLDGLQAKGLLSDSRFAAALVRTRAERFGAARIRHEMREHNLPEDTVRAATQALQATEEQRAHDLWQRRFGRPPADDKERARQMRFLAQRGFSTSVVVKVVRGAKSEDD